jgi:predicted DNA-binding transcriptional regulator YafY
MKSSRLLSALMLLQAHGRLSSRELAERLEVSERTAHRDMEALSASGVPVLALRGAQGGWELAKGWRTKVPGLDEAELRALLMAQPSALGDPRLVAAAERAFGKLMAAMPGSMRGQAASMRVRLHIDSTGWRPSAEDLSMLPVVQDAIDRDVKLSFMYRRADGESGARMVDPFGVVCKQTVWYLVARAPAGMRSYRISRMSEVVALAMPFKRPARFDLANYWKGSTAKLEKQRGNYVATLALAADAAAALSRWCQLVPAKHVPRGVTFPEGWVVMDVEFDGLSHALFMVLGFGTRAGVVAPDELRERVRNEVAGVVGISERMAKA